MVAAPTSGDGEFFVDSLLQNSLSLNEARGLQVVMVTLVEEHLPPNSTYVVGPADEGSKVCSMGTHSEAEELAAAAWPIDSAVVDAPTSDGSPTRGCGDGVVPARHTAAIGLAAAVVSIAALLGLATWARGRAVVR